MTPEALARNVAMLYTAAGRHYGKVELETYALALDDIDDQLGTQAVRDIIRGVDLGQRAPSPGLVIEAARAIRTRTREQQVGLPEQTDPPLPIEENRRRMAEAIAALRKPVPK